MKDIALLAVFFLSAPASLVLTVWICARRQKRQPGYHRSTKQQNQVYFYQNGEATKESRAQFVKVSELAVNILVNYATFGLLVAIASSVYNVIRLFEHSIPRWLQVARWATLVIQCLIIRLKVASSKQYALSLLIFSSSTLILLELVWSELPGLVKCRHKDSILVVFWMVGVLKMSSAAVVAVSSLNVPHCPDVYWGGRLVDRQFTTSAINRYSFSWASPLIALGKLDTPIEFFHLCAMDHNTRAANLRSRLDSVYKSGCSSLFFLLYMSHRRIFLWQWIMTVLQSIISYGPQFCMYKILILLEDESGRHTPDLWLWTAGLGTVRLVQSMLEARLLWLSFATLAISVRAQLSSVLFHKCMNMQNIKGGGGVSSFEDKNQDTELSPVERGEEDEEQPLLRENEMTDIPLEKLSEDGTKLEPVKAGATSHDAINLLSVDVQRISDFFSYNNIFPSVSVTSIIAIVALVKLIGWLSLVAGLSAWLLLMPVNTWASKHYNQAQINLMGARDVKTRLLTEALQGIREIKFSALEDRWENKIIETRKSELIQQWKIFAWALCLRFCWVAAPIFLSLAALATYAWQHGGLSASLAFTTLAIFGNIEWCLSVVPLFIAQFQDARVSSSRILGLLNSPEWRDQTEFADTIEFSNAVIRWPGNNSFRLNLSIKIPNGELSVIHGASGSGKTLVLSSIIGEANIESGSVYVPKILATPTSTQWMIPGAIAFVAQTPWLENATIRDNILFGLPHQGRRYQEAIEASALPEDLAIFPDGDMTEVGARGINLSGGQRWRMSLARAFYSRASILILDDIFSAVDTHVGKHILEKGLTGSICHGRTRILATHHTALCFPKASYIVELRDGSNTNHINAHGRRKEYRRNSDDHIEDRDKDHAFLPVELSANTSSSSKSMDDQGAEHPSVQRNPSQDVGAREGHLSVPQCKNGQDPDQRTKIDEGNQAEIYSDPQKSPLKPRKFVEEEFREHGDVRWAIYRKYLGASGGLWLWLPALVAIAASQLAILGRGWWMKVWTGTDGQASDPSVGPSKLGFFLAVYIIISLAAALLEILKCYLVYIGGLRASETLFSDLINRVLHAQTRWLDTVPLGRVLNRFTADFNSVDSKVPAENHALLSAVMSLVCVFIAGLLLSPFMAGPYLVLLAMSVYYTVQYIGAARELRRLEATARSPILDLFGNSMLGLDTIRAFGRSGDFTARMYARIDDWSKSTWAFWLITQWMSFRMGLMGTLFTVNVAIAIVVSDRVDAPLAGFALIFALNYSKGMEDTIKRSAAFQFNMNAIERIVEFSDMEIEDQTGHEPPASWPSNGRVEFENLEVGYTAELPPVLREFSAQIEPHQRIGVVGRTGAGKSSLTLALFRCLEARKGSITIDGIDISTLKLKQLRSRMTLIPQDPVLFSGNVRSNLDPFGQYTDAELCESLRHVHLSGDEIKSGVSKATSTFLDIDSPVHDGGQNLSQGQRQLLCLARACLTKSKIMVLDEATSAVDMATDKLIQVSLREQFAESTLIVIAHRLRTVADFDRILVMSEGRVEEFGSPEELMKRQGAFYRMILSDCNTQDSRDEDGSNAI